MKLRLNFWVEFNSLIINDDYKISLECEKICKAVFKKYILKIFNDKLKILVLRIRILY